MNICSFFYNKHYPMIFLAVFFAWPLVGYSEVIFSDDFDATPDWQNQGSLRCNWIGFDEASGGTDCANVPPNYDLIYVTNKNPASPMCEITNTAGRGSNGKGIRFYDESNGDRNSWGSDCQIAKYLGVQYPEVWVSYYVRYNPNIIWDGGSESVKTFRIGHYNPLVVNGDAGTSIFSTNNNSQKNRGLGSTTAGLLFFNIKHENPELMRLQQLVRCGGSYKCDGYDHTWFQNIVGAPGVSWSETLGDNKWHHMEIRMKMNSSIGAKDGVVEVYLDGTRQAKRTNVPFRLSGTKSDVTGFNMFTIGGNSSNVWAGQTNEEQHMYDFDDLRICTSRCPGSLAPLPPSGILAQ